MLPGPEAARHAVARCGVHSLAPARPTRVRAAPAKLKTALRSPSQDAGPHAEQPSNHTEKATFPHHRPYMRWPARHPVDGYPARFRPVQPPHHPDPWLEPRDFRLRARAAEPDVGRDP